LTLTFWQKGELSSFELLCDAITRGVNDRAGQGFGSEGLLFEAVEVVVADALEHAERRTNRDHGEKEGDEREKER